MMEYYTVLLTGHKPQYFIMYVCPKYCNEVGGETSVPNLRFGCTVHSFIAMNAVITHASVMSVEKHIRGDRLIKDTEPVSESYITLV